MQFKTHYKARVHCVGEGMQREYQRGYTLIELMFVLLVLGVLAAIALPAYFNYSTRAKASEGLSFFVPAKKGVVEYRLQAGRFPDNNSEAGLGVPTQYDGEYVESVTVGANGVVSVKFDDPSLFGGTLVWTPSLDPDGSVKWVCTTAIPHTLVPKTCRN